MTTSERKTGNGRERPPAARPPGGSRRSADRGSTMAKGGPERQPSRKPPEDQATRELAYRLWEARGRPLGQPERDWRDAELELARASRAADEASKESFPASDPPASALPDRPPANAEEKWAAAEDDASGSERATEHTGGAPAPAPPRRRRGPSPDRGS